MPMPQLPPPVPSEETFEEIAACVAHEIKNPLALALANISLIRLGDSERKYAKQCQVIENELEKINDMVVELVVCARGGQNWGAEEAVDAAEVLSGVIGEFRAANGALRFVTRGLEDEFFVRGDRRRLAMVFSNIIKNASEAQGGAGRVDVALRRAGGGGRLTFDDYGGGLSEAGLAGAGRRYYTTKKNGTGLGVLFCRNTMEQWGGKFSLENRAGPDGITEGCRVTLEFPDEKEP
ncbi:MAG: HAMP domain-containing histidine kinase [Firmicutes bacterium]|nr:HAMP domain-containing histidine kinase [Bacillota bacterium]